MVNSILNSFKTVIKIPNKSDKTKRRFEKLKYINKPFRNTIETIKVIGTHLFEMRELILRFPHLMIQILKKTNNEGLAKSRKVTTTWKKFIDEENYPWLRIVKIPTILQMDSTYGIPTYLHLAAEYGQNDVLK